MVYRAFGVVIDSDVLLPLDTAVGKIDCFIQEGIDHLEAAIPLRRVPQSERRPVSILLARHPAGTLVTVPEIGLFLISSQGIRYTIERDRDWTFIDTLLGPIFNIWLEFFGFLVFHGSAVRMAAGAVAFLGHRGQGKSTLAFHFLRRGYSIVSDDQVALRSVLEPWVEPSVPWIKVSPQTLANGSSASSSSHTVEPVTEKSVVRLSADEHVRVPLPLMKFYLLHRTDCGVPTFVQLPPHRSTIALLRHSAVGRSMAATGREASRLPLVAQLANRPSVWRVEIPDNLAALPDAVAAIEEHAATPIGD